MKRYINLLPPEPEKAALRGKQRQYLLISEIILVVFVIFNLGLFAIYGFLVKSTADTKEAIAAEEQKITALAPTEKLYRALAAKLTFLSTALEKKVAVEDAIEFSRTLIIPQVNLNKINFRQDGITTLSLVVADSSVLENFLRGVMDQEAQGRIKNTKLASTSRNKDGGYDLVLTFQFIKKQ
jgi:hypothetical protein